MLIPIDRPLAPTFQRTQLQLTLKTALRCSIATLTLALTSAAAGASLLPEAIASQFPKGVIASEQPVSDQKLRPLISQATRSTAMAQGTQITINGRTVSAPWMQWQSGGAGVRTGVSDAGVMQFLGADLLNTIDVAKQPIQWFSQPTTNPLVLPTRLAAPFRYLDLTEFARQAGWQVQASGSTLQINSPATKVVAVRQGKQTWGDRIVIELDRATPWQVDQRSQDVTVTLDAQVDPTLLQTFKPSLGNQVQAVSLEAAGNQTRLRLQVPAGVRPRVWSLPSPNRLIVDVRSDTFVERDILWAPGLRWRSQLVTLGADRFPVVWLAVNPRQPGIRVQPILPNPAAVQGTAPLVQTARQALVAGAINGGFFNRNNQLPLGAVRRDGRWFSGPILGRGAIAWTAAGDVLIDRLVLQEAVITPAGQRLPLTHLNSGYVQAGIARYTSDWGPTYTSLTDGEIVVTVQNNQVANQQTLGSVGSSAPIPANGYLLVLRSNNTAVGLLPVGASLRLESTTTPPEFDRYPQIVAAGPLLVRNRQIVLDAQAEKFSNAFVVERASRSAIGRTADGNLLIVAVHSRVNGLGPSLTEVAQLMQQLGATDALNLDGGSSTTLYLGGQILDRLPNTAARVHNGIGVFVGPNP